MAQRYPCVYPDSCGVSYHLDPAHCDGARRIKLQSDWDNKVGLRQEHQKLVEAGLGQKVNLSSLGLSGNWHESGQSEAGNNLYIQSVPTAGENEGGKYQEHMVAFVELEENESDETFAVRMRNHKSDTDGKQYMGAPKIANDNDLAKRVSDAHLGAEFVNNSISRYDKSDKSNAPEHSVESQNFDKEWIPAPVHLNLGHEFRKPLLHKESLNVGHIEEPKDEQEAGSVAFISAREDGMVRIVNHKRASYEQKYGERGADPDEEKTQRYDFRNRNSPLHKYTSMAGVKMTNGAEIAAPIEMREEVEQAANGHNKWVWEDVNKTAPID